jgi:hypothetical protein
MVSSSERDDSVVVSGTSMVCFELAQTGVQ